jgi:hypothetical protein
MEAKKIKGNAAATAAPAANETLTTAAANGSLQLYRKNKRAKEGNGASNGKYTRTHAVCEVLKASPNISRDECLIEADALFTEKTGIESNMPETYRRYRTAVHVLKIFGVL